MELQLKPQIFVFIGRPESGKSHFVKSIIHDYLQAGYFRFMTVYCKTKFKGDYDFVDNQEHVVEGWDEDHLKTDGRTASYPHRHCWCSTIYWVKSISIHRS
jgi:hypothetical protein